jgi:DNA polymerase (family X)
MDNRTIARRLMEYADHLDADEANIYRPRAYRRAAETVLGLDQPIANIVRERGRQGLETLPGIGTHLAYTIDGLVRTGEFHTLNPDGGTVSAERLFASLPGVGPRLARQIHEQLGIDTLEQLEVAAHEGRLSGLHVGPKRLRGIIDSLAGRLGCRLPEPIGVEPPVADLLAVDAAYRDQAARDRLPTIAPRRFNPDNEPWLPLLVLDRGGWRFRALFSNTALAHRLQRKRDWVVVYFDNNDVAGQRTVVTENRGELSALRVVRGREGECREHYRSRQPVQTG